MILAYYNILFALSVIFLLYMSINWRTGTDIDFAMFFFLVPIDILGYIKIATATNIETAILANELVYLGGCFLQLFVLLIICGLCHIHLNNKVRFLLFFGSSAMYLSTLTIGHSGIFYKSVSLEQRDGVSVLVKEYGPMHTLFYIMICLYLLGCIIALVYGYLKKPEASIKNIYYLTLLMFFSVLTFFGGRAITKSIEFSAAAYIFAEIIFILIFSKIRLYNITGHISNSVLENGVDGLICFDMKRNLLVSNKTAQLIMPELSKIRVDHQLPSDNPTFAQINEIIDKYEKDSAQSTEPIKIGTKIFSTEVDYILDQSHKSGYYVVLRDVTAEQNYLESTREYNIRMKEAADAAIAADNAKSTFLAQMSHEIRTPINAVLGMNEMIMRESEDEKILGYSSSIESSGRTLLSLINSILDFSKIEDGKMEIQEVDYDLIMLIDNLISSISVSLSSKKLKLITNIDESLPSELHGDDVRLNQILLNLLNNAVKYTDKGAVTLTITPKDDPYIDKEKCVIMHFEIRDTGIGIREEDIDRMFNSFERLDISRNRNVEGTGLGMTIVYKLLELMGSRIKVESEYGKGSVFSFDLVQGITNQTPIGDYEKHLSAAKLRKKENVSLYAPDARILVVDDNALNLKVARSFLNLCGITPDEAVSGDEAIEMMRNKTYDIVFLDHMMPKPDGIETLNILKNEALIPDGTTMIAFTANAIEGSKDMYLSAGFDDYVTKPMDLKKLVAKLEKYLA